LPRDPHTAGSRHEARRRYWLDRFSLDELRELAAGIWPSAV